MVHLKISPSKNKEIPILETPSVTFVPLGQLFGGCFHLFILASQVGSRIESSDPPFITYTNKVYKGFLNTKDIYSPKTTTLGLRIVNLMFLYSSGSFRVKLKIYRAPKGKDGLPAIILQGRAVKLRGCKLPETNSLPLKIDHPKRNKRKLVFQPSIFRCYVSLPEGMFVFVCG